MYSPCAPAEILLEGAGARPKKLPHREKGPKTEVAERPLHSKNTPKRRKNIAEKPA